MTTPTESTRNARGPDHQPDHQPDDGPDRAPQLATQAGSLLPAALIAPLVRLRRDLHRHPELSGSEHRSSSALRQALLDLAGLPDRAIVGVGGTGLVARVPGRDPAAPVVALRGDIDALPIQEETGLPYASINAGVMHACGHDIHASWAVGAAALLAREPAAGDVLVVLQPAEETGEGASAILASGALQDARAIFGGHVDRRFEVGQVVAEPGPLAASADTFEIELVGQGAHAARPHEAADPIVGAGTLITALQSIVSRRLNPADAGVLTLGTIHAGTASNIIPERLTLSGTLRAVSSATRALLREELERVTTGVAAAHRLRATISFDMGTPPLVNDPVATGWAREAVATALSPDALTPLGMLNLAAEDFAVYLERIPGCFMRVGAREPGGQPVAAHSPRFAPAEESLFVGAAVLAETARVASAALAG